jgi:hypothetical protein
LERQAGELLLQQAALASSAEAEFAYQLLVSGALPRGTPDAIEEFAVRRHGSLTMVQGGKTYHFSDKAAKRLLTRVPFWLRDE